MKKAILGLMIMVLVATAAAQGKVVGWRTDWTGKYPQADPPLKWSATEAVVWKTPMPSWSNSTPIIVGQKLFVCSEPTTLLCVDLKTGRILWQKDNATAAPLPKTQGVNGYSSPTPVSDGKRVYVLFGTGAVACYDLNGKRLWFRMIEPPRNANGWGHSASPVLIGSRLYVLINDLVCLNAADGKMLWRKAAKPRWGTPLPTMIGRTALLITPEGDFFRASDGRKMAARRIGLRYNQPIIDGGVVYFIHMDVSRAFRLPRRASGELQLAELWQTRLERDRFYSSPVIHNGLIYAINQKQTFHVVEARTGKLVYQRKLDLGRGQVYPSIALAGKYLYVSGMSGTTVVIEPGRRYKEVARNTLEPFRSSPVFAGKRMYIRGLKNLYCIGE